MDSLNNLRDLEKTIDALDPLIQECLDVSDNDFIASKNIHLAFTLNTLYLLHLRLTGQSLKGHPIKEEIARIKEYFKKLDTDRGMKLDKDAASRFIKGALTHTSFGIHSAWSEMTSSILKPFMFDDHSAANHQVGNLISKGFACDTCHKKKIKCIGPPPCQQCRMSHSECLMTRKMKRRGPRSKEYIDELEMKLNIAEKQLRSFYKISIGQFSSDSSALLIELRMDLITYYAENCLPYLNVLPKWLLIRNAAKLSPFFLNSVYLLANWTMQIYSAQSAAFYEDCQRMIGQYLHNQSVFTLIGLLNLAIYSSCINNDGARSTYTVIAMRMAASMDHLAMNDDTIDPALSDLNARLVIEIKSRVFWYCYIADVGACLSLDKPQLCFRGNIACIIPSNDAIWTLDDYELSSVDSSKSTVLGYTSDDNLRDPSPNESHLWKEVILYKIYARLRAFLENLISNTPKANDDEYRFLKDSLTSWYQSLPTRWLENLNCRLPPFNVEKRIESYWAWAYNLLMYHSLVIKLFRAVLQNHTLSFDSKSVQRQIFDSSQFISNLCLGFLKSNPKFSFVSPFVTLWIFEGGIGWTCFAANRDPATSILFKQGMAVIIECLDKNASIMHFSADKSEKLNRLRKIGHISSEKLPETSFLAFKGNSGFLNYTTGSSFSLFSDDASSAIISQSETSEQKISIGVSVGEFQ